MGESTKAKQAVASPENSVRTYTPPVTTIKSKGLEGFLAGYRPKDRSWTSQKEMDEITRVLRLNDRSREELTNLRNKVVSYYSGRMRQGREYMPSMQSVTAVIDHVMMTKYGYV